MTDRDPRPPLMVVGAPRPRGGAILASSLRRLLDDGYGRGYIDGLNGRPPRPSVLAHPDARYWRMGYDAGHAAGSAALGERDREDYLRRARRDARHPEGGTPWERQQWR